MSADHKLAYSGADYITHEIQRQKDLESTSKEELAREIRILRSKIGTSTEQIKALEDHIRTLKAGIGI